MKTRRIGSLDVTPVGLGCNNFGWFLEDEAASGAVIDAAFDAGINFFDTADVYGDGKSEILLGKALRGRRNRAVIATKFGYTMGSFAGGAKPEYIRTAVEGSLKRLGVDVIDLYLLHWPDPKTPLADTLGAMDELVKAGKVREIGCGNMTSIRIPYEFPTGDETVYEHGMKLIPCLEVLRQLLQVLFHLRGKRGAMPPLILLGALNS